MRNIFEQNGDAVPLACYYSTILGIAYVTGYGHFYFVCQTAKDDWMTNPPLLHCTTGISTQVVLLVYSHHKVCVIT